MISMPRDVRKWLRRRLRPKPKTIAILVSYPKSGRTWLRVIFDELGVPIKYTHDGMGMSKLRPFERQCHGARSVYQTGPIIFLSRDPRDTVVSAYFHAKHRVKNYNGDIAQFIRDPFWGMHKIVQFNLRWFELGRSLPLFLPITYEQTTVNTIDVVRKITEFIGVKVPEAYIRDVVKRNTFEQMQKRESRDEYRRRYGWMLSPGDPSEPESYKLRRGRIGGFRDYLSEEDVAYCDAVLERHRYFDEIESASRGAIPSNPGVSDES